MREKTKLKIGEFSQMMQVTVKTLRHYEHPPMSRFSRGMPSRRLRHVSQFSELRQRSQEPTCTPG